MSYYVISGQFPAGVLAVVALVGENAVRVRSIPAASTFHTETGKPLRFKTLEGAGVIAERARNDARTAVNETLRPWRVVTEAELRNALGLPPLRKLARRFAHASSPSTHASRTVIEEKDNE